MLVHFKNQNPTKQRSWKERQTQEGSSGPRNWRGQQSPQTPMDLQFLDLCLVLGQLEIAAGHYTNSSLCLE